MHNAYDEDQSHWRSILETFGAITGEEILTIAQTDQTTTDLRPATWGQEWARWMMRNTAETDSHYWVPLTVETHQENQTQSVNRLISIFISTNSALLASLTPTSVPDMMQAAQNNDVIIPEVQTFYPIERIPDQWWIDSLPNYPAPRYDHKSNVRFAVLRDNFQGLKIICALNHIVADGWYVAKLKQDFRATMLPLHGPNSDLGHVLSHTRPMRTLTWDYEYPSTQLAAASEAGIRRWIEHAPASRTLFPERFDNEKKDRPFETIDYTSLKLTQFSNLLAAQARVPKLTASVSILLRALQVIIGRHEALAILTVSNRSQPFFRESRESVSQCAPIRISSDPRSMHDFSRRVMRDIFSATNNGTWSVSDWTTIFTPFDIEQLFQIYINAGNDLTYDPDPGTFINPHSSFWQSNGQVRSFGHETTSVHITLRPQRDGSTKVSIRSNTNKFSRHMLTQLLFSIESVCHSIIK